MPMNMRSTTHEAPTRNLRMKPRAWTIQPVEEMIKDQKYQPERPYLVRAMVKISSKEKIHATAVHADKMV